MRWFSVVVVVLALTAPAAASRKVLVLPIEGTADATTRMKLTTEVARLAKAQGDQVTTGSATFADTALAVGCDPEAAGCSDTVIATLGVDELVWGIATKKDGKIQLIVRRAAQGAPVREASTTIAAGGGAAAVAPLFSPPAAGSGPEGPEHSAPPTVPDDSRAPPSPAGGPLQPGPADDRRDRTVGIAMISGGSLGLVLGLSLWVNYASLQRSIDRHPVRTIADIRDLQALEDKAGSRAILGDVFVAAGLAAAGIGGYFLYRDHKRHAITVAPTPVANGGGLAILLTGGW